MFKPIFMMQGSNLLTNKNTIGQGVVKIKGSQGDLR